MTSSELAPLLNLSNTLKTTAEENNLVDSQLEALDNIRGQLQDEPLVALIGSEGVGKTFIAWVLRNELGYTYNTWPVKSMSGSDVVIDNAPSDRVDARGVRAQCRLNSVSNCVYITDHQMREAKTIPTVTLRLSKVEEKSIIHRWEKVSNGNLELTSTSILSARKELNQH
jgi:ABC-type phosphate/phosphonate transport system ATPase subunit